MADASIAELLEQAVGHMSAGRPGAAIRSLQKAVLSSGDDVRSLLKCGDLLSKLGARNAAAEAYLKVADSYEQDGFWLKAVAVLKQTERLVPEHPVIAARLARLYSNLGLAADAVSQLQRLVERARDAGDEGVVYRAMEQILELDPLNPEALTLLDLHPPRPKARNAELEALIASEPAKVQHYQVYSDWLQNEGDPRGELVAVQCALSQETDPDARRSLLERNTALLAEHSDYLLWRLGAHVQVDWRYGFLAAARCSAPTGFATADYSVHFLETLLDLPSAPFIQKLEVQTGAQLRHVVATRRPPLLRELRLWHVHQNELADVTGLFAAFPDLRALAIRAGSLLIGSASAARLQSLHLELGSGGPVVERLVDSDLPALREMHLISHSLDLEDTQQLLSSSVASNLEVLGLAFTPGLHLNALPHSLQHLDMDISASAAGRAVQEIQRAAERLRELESVRITGTLTEEQIDRIRAVGDQITVETRFPANALFDLRG